eukprot:Plantae.Rhodophyta-Hildenbrandia_rubra.ctg4168.p1 GENE.Plantae.Rhodophyta-Hildenbrandia_rubra.ctg4168~~Plantae.Rhodophyta-Hildenbrandia_rubra.ctg4168.p1  ORF type:complete len:521 (+),score=55.18 Plantae.Rhodophyta-Hildenbrandia_rubra.ctg4168:133-1695(+)
MTITFAIRVLLLTVIFSSLIFLTQSTRCTCNGYIKPPSEDPFQRSTNSATTMGLLLLHLLPKTPAPPRVLALVSTAMYDAYVCTSNSSMSPTIPCDNSNTKSPPIPYHAVSYAAFTIMKKVFEKDQAKSKLLVAVFKYLGYDPTAPSSSRESGMAAATKVMMRYKLRKPGNYAPTNKPSMTYDAMCGTIKDSDKWQGQCVQSEPGQPCVPQKYMVNMILNGPLFTNGGNASIKELVDLVPAPPRYAGEYPSSLPLKRGQNKFLDQFLTVLKVSSSLNDYKKTSVEFFLENAGIKLYRFAIMEAVAYKLDTRKTVALLFAMGVAVNDAFIATANVKAKYDFIRPVTVLQCAFRGVEMRAWRQPYGGVETLVNGEKGNVWNSYAQTPGFPGYTSGHAAVGASGSIVLNRFFGYGQSPSGGNCYTQMAGGSNVEPRIEKGSTGFIDGVTNVMSNGAGSRGYSPARNVTICWSNWTDMSMQLTNSRLYAGIHVPIDNREGYLLGRKVGRRAFKYAKLLFGKLRA